MRAAGIGQVIRSTMKGYNKFDMVLGGFGLQEYTVVQNPKRVEKMDPSLALPINAWMSVLGTTGLTAYFGFLKIGHPQPGDTVLISGASGATGSVVGQIAKLMSCRVIGIAGSDQKCNYLVNDLKFDAVINYKASTSLSKQIKQLCPNGVDVFFDNVGGDALDAALMNLAHGARVVLCGAISQYNAKNVKGPTNYMSLLVKRAQMKGFVILDYVAEFSKARQRLAGWVHQNLITYKVAEFHSLESWISAITSLFTGQNDGKCILTLSLPSPMSSM